MSARKVVEPLFRCASQAEADWLLTQLRALAEDRPGIRLDAAGVFDEDIFDAPDLPEDIVGVPA